MNKLQLAIISLLVVIAGFQGFIVVKGGSENSNAQAAGIWSSTELGDIWMEVSGKSDDGRYEVVLRCNKLAQPFVWEVSTFSFNTGKSTSDLRGSSMDTQITQEFLWALNHPGKEYAYLDAIRFTKGNYQDVVGKISERCKPSVVSIDS